MLAGLVSYGAVGEDLAQALPWFWCLLAICGVHTTVSTSALRRMLGLPDLKTGLFPV